MSPESLQYCYRLLLCPVLLLCCIPALLAQTPKTNGADTTAILKLIATSRSVGQSQPEKARQLINEALEKSLAANYQQGMARSYARLGRWYFGNNINNSVAYAQKALALFETKVTDNADKADMYLLLAEAYDEQGHTDSSAYYYYLLGDELQPGSDIKPEFMIEVYTKLAIFWVNLNQDNKDEKLSKTIKEYVEKAKAYASQLKDTAVAASGIHFLQGVYYHGRHEFDSARANYLQFLASREKAHQLNIFRKISTESNIADTYLQQNRPTEALYYINEIRKLGNDPGKSNYLSFFMAFIGLQEGKALHQLQQYQASINVLKQSLQKLQATGGHLRNEVVEAYKIMADDYEALHNYQAALATRNTYISLNDSLTRKEKTDMISRLEIRYRIEEKNRELLQQRNAIATAENKIKARNIFIIGVLALCISLLLLLMVWRRQYRHKQKLQQQSIENLQQKIKIERLNATIAGEEKERTRIARELHDGIGGLLTAAKMNFELFKQHVLPGNKPDFQVGLTLLEDAGTELRQAAKNLMPHVLLQDGLVKAVKDFCERVTQQHNINVHFQVSGENKNTDSHLELTIYRIIQELLHNIVKHSGAGNAIVQMDFQEDGGMSITVEDNGVGIRKTTLANSAGGMGLKNIEERIKEFGGRLDISSEEGQGTSFFIEFEPLNKQG